MNAETLERLRKEIPPLPGPWRASIVAITPNALERLLDEREALLDALRDMLICLEAHSVVEEVEEYVQRAKVAIAKAEAE